MYASIKALALFLSVYPAVLLTQLLLENVMGDSQLIDEFEYGSKVMLLKTICSDWIDSCVWVLPAMFGAILFVKFVPRSNGLTIIVTVSATIGLVGIMSNAIPEMLAITIAYALLTSVFYFHGRRP